MGFNARKVKWGAIFIAAGAILLAHNYGLLSFEIQFSRDWPAILIAIGLLGAWDGLFHGSHARQTGGGSRKEREALRDILEKIERGEIKADEAARRMKE